ncbi:hypothetical protein KIPB_011885 [Kipferlia bialata]|uniref:Cyclin-like domain-containing protein n=1 Tax=Kipferlia bialata TaxID=797122 RepID=A0A9K3D6Q5_9EUKA|nr:hypothetical protein KIPB_011885 [Kipferlia bialata]|eukprot:g11885.t1
MPYGFFSRQQTQAGQAYGQTGYPQATAYSSWGKQSTEQQNTCSDVSGGLWGMGSEQLANQMRRSENVPKNGDSGREVSVAHYLDQCASQLEDVTNTTLFGTVIEDSHMSVIERPQSAVPQVMPNASPYDIHAIDTEHHANPRFCTGISEQVFRNLRVSELNYRVDPHYCSLIQRAEINPHVVHLTVDWMVERAHKLRLSQESLFLACAYLHRFLERETIASSQLYLLAISCLFIACKFYEPLLFATNGRCRVPSIDKFVATGRNRYTKAELKQMELVVLDS